MIATFGANIYCKIHTVTVITNTIAVGSNQPFHKKRADVSALFLCFKIDLLIFVRVKIASNFYPIWKIINKQNYKSQKQ